MQISTARVYASLDPMERKNEYGKNSRIYRKNDIYSLAKHIVNVMEEVVVKKNP